MSQKIVRKNDRKNVEQNGKNLCGNFKTSPQRCTNLQSSGQNLAHTSQRSPVDSETTQKRLRHCLAESCTQKLIFAHLCYIFKQKSLSLPLRLSNLCFLSALTLSIHVYFLYFLVISCYFLSCCTASTFSAPTPASEPRASEHFVATARLSSLGASPTTQTHMPPMASHGIPWHRGTLWQWCRVMHDINAIHSWCFHELPWTQKQNLFCSNKRIAKYCKANAANSRNAHLHQGSLAIPQLFPLILMMGRRSCEAPQLDEHTAILDACIRRHLKLSCRRWVAPCILFFFSTTVWCFQKTYFAQIAQILKVQTITNRPCLSCGMDKVHDRQDNLRQSKLSRA